MINKKFEARKKTLIIIATNRKFDYLRWFGKRTITWCTSTIFLFKIPLIFYNMSSWPRMMLFSLTTNNPGCLMDGRAWVGCLPLCRWVLVLQDVRSSALPFVLDLLRTLLSIPVERLGSGDLGSPDFRVLCRLWPFWLRLAKIMD